MSAVLRELTRAEFEATLKTPMQDVTSTADEVVELWSYAEPALRAAFPASCSCDLEVAHIFEAPDGSYQHVLAPSHASNVYLVVVIDKRARSILGHYCMDLGALYGVT